MATGMQGNSFRLPWHVAGRQGQLESIRVSYLALPIAVSACGGSGGSEETGLNPATLPNPEPSSGLPDNYEAPGSTYTAPITEDSNRYALQTAAVDPYWVAALRNPEFDSVTDAIDEVSRTVAYSFPETRPDYYDSTENADGWQPATPAMQVATREILARLQQVIDHNFVETTDILANNVIVVSQTVPSDPETAGYAYYPSSVSPLGSDVLISTQNAGPTQSMDGQTNFDYELLVHELGHALGLKHPFEPDGANTATLNTIEDNTVWTTMSYDTVASSLDGAFRTFDLMALTEAYGVSPSHRSGDDTYMFSSGRGVFVIDGNGMDTISGSDQFLSVTIDLREGQQSYVGATSKLISQPEQLAISANSKIENAIGGLGDDSLTGNALDNLLEGSAGADTIFAGEGADIVNGGGGADLVDLSEVNEVTDTLIFDLANAGTGVDVVYSFTQGVGGDVIQFVGTTFEALLDVVSADKVPEAFVQGNILRLVDTILDTTDQVVSAFDLGGAFDNLNIASGGQVMVITADSQATGAAQKLFHVESLADGLEVVQLAQFEGNYLDIDSWLVENFV